MSDNIIKLERIKLEQLPGLKQMMHCYLEDLSKYAIDLEPKEDGKFVYDGLEYYFTEKELAPFFIYSNEQIVGFALVNSGSYVPMAVNYSIHEFYITPDFRGRGIGSIAVNAIFDCFKGKYKIEQLSNNKPAIAFWHSIYNRRGIEYSEIIENSHGEEYLIQIFNTEVRK